MISAGPNVPKKYHHQKLEFYLSYFKATLLYSDAKNYLHLQPTPNFFAIQK